MAISKSKKKSPSKLSSADIIRSLLSAPVNDIATLVASLSIDNPDPLDPHIASLDLSLISEIKRSKGSCAEVKMLDRIELVKLLIQLENQSLNKDSSADFFAALSTAASLTPTSTIDPTLPPTTEVSD